MSQIRNTWSAEEDEIIKETVIGKGLKKWTKIALSIKDRLGIDHRTGKQCRERWNNTLNPDITKETWTEEEENTIFELQQQLGNKWSEIATHLPGRTDNSIKNCFYSAIRRNLRKYNRKRPESEKLKGSLKNLLRRPATRGILMKKDCKTEPNQSVKSNKTGRNYIKEEDRPNDIIIPLISPLQPIGIYSFPVTPSTTPSVLSSSKFSSSFFNFPEEGTFIDPVFMQSACVTPTDLIRSESTTPRYFLPNFSPRTTFQHYFTPRNSD